MNASSCPHCGWRFRSRNTNYAVARHAPICRTLPSDWQDRLWDASAPALAAEWGVTVSYVAHWRRRVANADAEAWLDDSRCRRCVTCQILIYSNGNGADDAREQTAVGNYCPRCAVRELEQVHV